MKRVRQGLSSVNRNNSLLGICIALFLGVWCGVQAQTLSELSVTGPTEIRFGHSAQYEAVVAGNPVTAVAWAVNGFVGGTVSTGPMSGAGAYLPASSIFAGHSVTITATTKVRPATSASLTVRILNPLPHLTSGSVTQSVAARPFLLKVRGTGFVSTSQLQMAGASVATVFVSPTELQSTVQLAAGTTMLKVGVLNPNAQQSSAVTLNLPVQPAPLPMLTVAPANLSFGDVTLNTASMQSVTLSSTGTGPVTINWASLSGSGFTMNGAAFPVTLNPGLAITLGVQFNPQAAGPATGQLLINSNSSVSPAVATPLSGAGVAPIALFVSPASVSLTTAATRQFTASVTGSSNTAVLWTVSGSGCSKASCGTISSGGFYTAPAVAPVPATVTVTAAAQADQTKNATSIVTITNIQGATYYLATHAGGGNDANSGLSPATPWLSPNHPAHCGDVILVAPGSYNNANFGRGQWGTVTCSANNSVAWLKCAVFDTCRISVTSGTGQGMNIDRSYWGVQGWEVSTAGAITYGTCFSANPSSSSNIHHIIFANNIANGCAQSGFSAYGLYGTGSVDYIAYLGNIAYNSTQGSASCTSGFNVGQPSAADTVAGTHIYVAGNFSYDNLDPSSGCAGTAPTDGEGINFDTWDDDGVSPYVQQSVIENNIAFLNGGFGIEVEKNNAGTIGNAHIFIMNNTLYGDRRDNAQIYCLGNSELDLLNANDVRVTGNLIYTGFPTNCEGNVWYAMTVALGNGSDSIMNNFASGIGGNNTFTYASAGFTYGSGNVLGINPNFANPVDPGAPSCSSYPSVPACMATVIANFTPTLGAAQSYGYQKPVTNNVEDSFFPQWLCTADVPSGLVVMGCQTE